MTLQDFLATFKSWGVSVTIQNQIGDEICTILSGGVSALDETVKNCYILRWEITGVKSIVIRLENGGLSA